MRKKIVAANWKMNLSKKEADLLLTQIKKGTSGIKSNTEIIVFTHDLAIENAVTVFSKSKKVSIGIQNTFHEDKGAFTGELSAEIAKSFGVKYVLCGHSERRSLFGESDEITAKKVNAALAHNLNIVLCVGEDLATRNKKKQNEKVSEQLAITLGGLDKKFIAQITIAYEPVWAIGTGVTATTAQAQEMHAFIRKELVKILGKNANDISILYGGSCNEKNAKELFSCKDVDGGLIGGASLKADSFLQIVKANS